jgi:hypothetical protein
MMFKSDQSACAVQFSPFVPGKLAVATSQNFGVVGNGRLVVLQPSQQGLQQVASFDTVDGAHTEPPQLAKAPWPLCALASRPAFEMIANARMMCFLLGARGS